MCSDFSCAKVIIATSNSKKMLSLLTRHTFSYGCLLFLHINLTFSFNLENRLPIVKINSNPSSYFGYSIATHTIGKLNWPNNTNWLLVGAPLDKNLQPGTNHSGALYKCPITQNLDDCEQVITDGRSYNNDENEELSKPSNDEIKEDQWLGVTVRSQGLGGKVLVCAHRYVIKVHEHRYGQGLCYVLTNKLNYDEVYEPCKGRTVQRAHEDYGFCQVGTSGALLDDDTMVLGSPGPFTWRGTIFVTEIGGEYLERDKNMFYGDHSDTSSPVDKYSYLGMSVTGARYFGERISYAAGAPRANGHGQVIIFDKGNRNPIPVHMIIEGEQFASSFGYELTTADINGDQKPDLIIAAPFYFNKSEGGAVYVYQNSKDDLPNKPTTKLTGSLESRFGLALANIGDINKDNCDDLAVGAPYEDDGVVYIYLGSRKGITTKPSQRIESSDLGFLPKAIKTFGSSITGGTDLDGNSYPDIVIGAYNSSAVVALLSRPIISIQTKWRSNEMKNIDPTKSGCVTDAFTNLTCFTFEACCSIDPYEQTSADKDLKLLYTVEAETFAANKKFSRVFFDRDDKRSNVIKRAITVRTDGRFACQKVTGYIKENTRDIQSPIKLRLNYTLVESNLPDSALKALYPVLDKTKANIEFAGIFQKDCGEDDICECNLELNAKIDLNMENEKYSFILGEQEEIRVNINLTNSADSAYEAQLFIVHQKSVSYIAALKTSTAICNRFNETTVVCSIGNPMRRGTTAQVSIRFNPSGLELDEHQLTFYIFANSTSNIVSKQKAEVKINVYVVKRAKLSLRGWATPEQSFYSGEVKLDDSMMQMEDVGSQLIHTYQIYNGGPWKAPKVQLTIYWPYQLFSEKHKRDKWLFYLEEMPVIENAGQGNCFVPSEYINPLKLKYKSKSNPIVDGILLGSAPFMMKPINKTHFGHRTLMEKFSQNKLANIENQSLNRLRRDTLTRIIRPERFRNARDNKNIKRDIVEVVCNKATANCIKIQCEIYNMPPNSEAYVHVKARLWNSTLVSEHPRVDAVRIISTAQVHIPFEFRVEQTQIAESLLVETRAYPELIVQQRDTSLSLWIIILAIIGGLLLLALFTYAMWMCGFFKRRRPDPTLSGEIRSKSGNIHCFNHPNYVLT